MISATSVLNISTLLVCEKATQPSWTLSTHCITECFKHWVRVSMKWLASHQKNWIEPQSKADDVGHQAESIITKDEERRVKSCSPSQKLFPNGSEPIHRHQTKPLIMSSLMPMNCVMIVLILLDWVHSQGDSRCFSHLWVTTCMTTSLTKPYLWAYGVPMCDHRIKVGILLSRPTVELNTATAWQQNLPVNLYRGQASHLMPYKEVKNDRSWKHLLHE